MRYTRFATLFIAALVMLGLAACDFSEQNYDIEPGDSLEIVGSEEVVVPDTAAYYVRAFTILRDYSWSLEGDGAEILDVRRDGEFIDVAFTEAGTYTIEVTATGGGDPEYTGTLEVTAEEAEETAAESTSGR